MFEIIQDRSGFVLENLKKLEWSGFGFEIFEKLSDRSGLDFEFFYGAKWIRILKLKRNSGSERIRIFTL